MPASVRSEMMEKEAAVLPLPAASVAAPLGSETLTGPSAVGMTLKVNVLELFALKLAIEPLVTTSLEAANPVTPSEKVIVIGMAANVVGFVAGEENVAVGAVVSGTFG